jgi:HAD superfamily hydrolase (TIGR01509 family)
MIKLVIFDLDGVLMSSKDLHFNALNDALKCNGQSVVTMEEHISVYDGNPTSWKLEKRNVPVELRSKINNDKQEYTFKLLEEMLSENKNLIKLFKQLRDENYYICVASNSIRYTIMLSLFKLGLMEYVDYVCSNQDVQKGKPNPEMYLKCMVECGVGPRETLIVEDSYVGREGVFNSGAYLCGVNDPTETTYEMIKTKIDKFNGKKNKWRDNKMNVLIPMAGAGSRFANAGYTFPKPLIEVNGKPMIQVVIENLNIEATYTYIVQKEHYEKYNLNYLLEIITPGCNIVQVDSLTEGAACTTLLAKEFIDNDQQLLIANSDQWVDWDSSDFMYSLQGDSIDGGILTFESTHPKWSYVKTDNHGWVTELKEKMVISNNATVGIYHWKRGSDYVKYAEQMITKNLRVNNEFYVAPVYNEAIDDGKKIKTYNCKKMMGLGTPEDLNVFLKEV